MKKIPWNKRLPTLMSLKKNLQKNVSLSYLGFEIRRAFRCFGRLALTSLLLAVICTAIGYSLAGNSADSEPVSAPFTVVVSIPEGSGLHYTLALGMVTQMDSFQSMCTVLRTSSEEEAQAMLDAGEAEAAVIIPEGMIHSILEGANVPARVIYPASPSVETVLFRNMIDSLAHMLGTAQSGVYALYDIYEKYGAGTSVSNRANSALNSDYIGLVLSRTELFANQPVSYSRETPSYLTFLAGALTLLMLLAGICLCGYLAPQPQVLRESLTRLGVPPLLRLLAPAAGAFCIQFCLFAPFAAAGMLFKLPDGLVLRPGVFLSLAFCELAAAAFQLLIYRLCRTRGAGMITLFLFAFLLVFAAGGLLPSAFLPGALKRLNPVNPAYHMLRAIQAAMSGTVSAATLAALAAESILCLLLTAAVSAAFDSRQTFRRLSSKKAPSARPLSLRHAKHRMTAWLLITAQRLWKRPVYWLLALGMVAGGIGAGSLAAGSHTIPIAIYCSAPDEFTQEILERLTGEGKDRLYRFYRADSQKQLEEDILLGYAECGFLFPDALLAPLRESAEGAIIACTGPSTVLTEFVKEEVYAAVLDSYAPVMLQDFIVEKQHISPDPDDLAEDVDYYFHDWADSGAVFRVEYEDVDEHFFENDAAFVLPLRGILSLLLLAAVMAGVSQYRHDRSSQQILVRSMREKFCLPPVYALLPAVLPALAGLVYLYLGRAIEYPAAELLQIAVYLVLLTAAAVLLSFLIKSNLIFDALIPLLIVFCLLYAPVIMDLSPYLPWKEVLSWFAPANWYLRAGKSA